MHWIFDCPRDGKVEKYLLGMSEIDLIIPAFQIHTKLARFGKEAFVMLRLDMRIPRLIWISLILAAFALIWGYHWVLIPALLFLFVDTILQYGLLFKFLADRKIRSEGWGKGLKLVSDTKFVNAYARV